MKNILLIFLLIFALPVIASEKIDTDGDGILDNDEIQIYKTDPNMVDTDGDGYSDWVELNNGYSPLEAQSFKLEESDYDNDGLSDRMELNFHTDLKNPDTDGDGYLDGVEIDYFYNPTSSSSQKLKKRLEVNISKQELYYYLGDVRMGTMMVSSGRAGMYTPTGHFQIELKHPKAWSPYGLWMPYWMEFTGGGKYGLHALPIWPSGYTEGEESLGNPVSHGCVRLGSVDAEWIYNWTDLKTPLFIY